MQLISRDKFSRGLGALLAYLALLRASNIGWGYPSAESDLSQIGYLPQKLMQMAILALLLLYAWINRRYIPRPYNLSEAKIAVWFVLTAIIGLAIALSPESALAARFLLSLVVVSLPIYLFWREHGGEALYCLLRNAVAGLAILCIAYVVLFPEYGVMTGIHSGAWRGVFVHKNTMGGALALGVVLFYAELLAWRHYRQPFASGLLFSLCLILVVLSKSSSALVIVIASITCYHLAAFASKVAHTGFRLGLVLVYFFLVIIAVLVLEFYLQQILQAFGRDMTLTGRTGLWHVLLELSYQRPLQGWGIGLFERQEVMMRYSIQFGWAAKTTHNSYLDLVLGLGYPAALLIIVILISQLIRHFILVRPSQEGALNHNANIAMFAGGLVYAFSSSGALLSPSLVWLFVLACFLISRKPLVQPVTGDIEVQARPRGYPVGHWPPSQKDQPDF